MTSSKRILAIVAVTCLAISSLIIFSGCDKIRETLADKTNDTAWLDATDKQARDEAAESAADENIVMTIKGDRNTYVLKGEEYIESGCQAFDKKKGVITNPVSIEGTVDTSEPGQYEIEYMAVSDSGGTAKAKRTVHVVESFEEEAKNIPVLMYHYVYSKDDKPASIDGNYLLDTKLADQCEYLTTNDYYFPSYQELRAWVDGKHTLPVRSVILTFDDGQEGFFKHGVPVLEKYQVPATSFIIGTKAGKKPRKYASPYVQYQSHSYNMHRPGGGNIGRGGVIYAYSKSDIADDIKKSDKLIGESEAFAYPFGDNDAKAQEGLKDAGIICAFTIINARVHPGDDPMALNRVRISGDYSLESYKYLVAPNA